MEDPGQLSEYGKILLMAIVGMLLVCATIYLAKVLSPKNPNPIKLSTYECGEDSVGSAWIQFNPRFYVIALIFLLFDVELIFIFPWATVFGNADFIAADARWGWFTLVEMAVFIGILIVGLIYVWKSGDISWIKPEHRTPRVAVNIPSNAYERLNQQQYAVRDYKEPLVEEVNTEHIPIATAPKIGFKPKFKKPSSES